MRLFRKPARIALLTLALTIALVHPVFAASGSINATDVRFRSVPDTASKSTILRLLDKGTTLEVLKKENSWYQVKIGDTTGYVYSTYVTVHPEPAVKAAPTPIPTPVPTPTTPAPALSPTPAPVAVPEVAQHAVTETMGAASEVPASPVLLVSEITLIAEEAPETAPASAPAASTPTPTPVPENRVLVEANTLNIRQSSSPDSDLLGKVVFGQEVVLLEPGEGYSKIRTDDGVEGYILSLHLVPVAATVSRASNELVDELLAYAMTFQGVKYVHAGMSPNGFDCSGFVKYVYKGIGIDTPRSSRDYGTAGVAVSRSEMVPGDVILWDTDGSRVRNISHVGIYVGNNKFIHASSTLNRVLVASVSGYRATFLGVRRFLE